MKGCLSCQDETCIQCDNFNNYRLVEGSCELQEAKDCVKFALDGTCIQCAQGFIHDETLRGCQKVEDFRVVDKCKIYAEDSSCAFCEEGHFLDNQICSVVNKQIPNCELYLNDSTCYSCKEGFILSLNKKHCREIVAQSQCASYSIIMCKQCTDSAISDVTYELEQIAARGKELTSINRAWFFELFNLENRFYKDYCVNTKVTNCVQFSNYKTCTKCADGFFLQENECKENPKNFIDKCESYLSSSECRSCQQGYFLETSTTCSPVEPVTNCVEYDPEAASTSCTRCDSTHYLEEMNTCTLRTLELADCLVPDPDNDLCGTCQSGMRVTDDGKRCLNLIDNCVTYASSSAQSDAFACNLCAEGFYIENNNCVQGNVEFCRVYETNNASCSVCEQKYYLENNLCKPHDLINSCSEYSNSERNVCVKCQ